MVLRTFPVPSGTKALPPGPTVSAPLYSTRAASFGRPLSSPGSGPPPGTASPAPQGLNPRLSPARRLGQGTGSSRPAPSPHHFLCRLNEGISDDVELDWVLRVS